MKHLLIGMLVLVAVFPLCVLGGMWFGYGLAQVSEWPLRNTSIRAVMPPLYTTTIVKSDRLACDGRG